MKSDVTWTQRQIATKSRLRTGDVAARCSEKHGNQRSDFGRIAESFEEYLGESVEDDKVSLEDTTELLDTYVDAVETDLDKDHLKVELRKLYTEAQNLEVVWFILKM